ncbi:MAG TPA: hypothetical protein VED37_02645 [Ktedonobacteraceae bacterium]|nr:hypothetical protein [Ktedonobacteraceae bacterium]
MQRVQQVYRRRHIRLPPPTGNRPVSSFHSAIQPGHKAIPIEHRQHIIAPAALGFGLVDFPQVVEVEELGDTFAIPEDTVERAEEDNARLRQWCIQEWERAGGHVVKPLFLANMNGREPLLFNQLGNGFFAFGSVSTRAPDSCFGVGTQQANRLKAARDDPFMIFMNIVQTWDVVVSGRNDAFGAIIIVAARLTMVRHQFAAGP